MNNVNVFVKTNNKSLSLIIGLIMIIVMMFFIAKNVFLNKPLTHAEIDQLEMQASYGKDEQSFQQLKHAAEHEQVNAQLALGKVYMFKQQSPQAIEWLSLAAQNHSAEAATLLGKIYFKGDQQIAKNYSTALKWFMQAYQQQDPIAAYYLGLMHKNGYGTQIHSEQAVKFFELAAKHNIPSAMFMLANAYQFGDGVKVDLKQALHWYEAAAELELPEAIQELAHIYQYGNALVPADQTAYQRQLLEIGHSLKHPAITP